MKKFLLAIVAVFTCFAFVPRAFADDSSGALPVEIQAVFDELAQVTEFDEQGLSFINFGRAYELGLSDEALEIGKYINSIREDIRQNGFREGVKHLRVAIPDLTRYGHYCGAGNIGWEYAPIDNLDSACRNHDMCWTGWTSSRACNRRFINELRPIMINHAGTWRGTYAAAAYAIFLPLS